MCGHIWTAFLNPIDRPLFLLLSFRQLFLVSSSTPNLLFTYPTHRCFLSLCFFSLAVTFIPTLALLGPCFVCSHRVTWGNRSVQCTKCSLWVDLSCSGLSPDDFCKISPGHSWTCPMCQSSSQPPSLSHPNPATSSTNTPNPPSSPTNTHKPISSKINPPKQFSTINNPTDPPNHPKLIFNYPLSASSIPPPPQTQHAISPLTQSSFHLKTTF